MSDPVSSMDVEDVLSSIRRLVSEEAKGNGTTNESASAIASADLHEEAVETAAAGALSDIVQAVEDSGEENGADGSSGSAYDARVPPSNDDFDDTGASLDSDDNQPEDGQVSFRHKARGSLRQDNDQKLVLTAAFRVADEPDDAPAADTADAGVSQEDAPAYPHLRSVEDLSDDDMAASGSGGSGGSGADKLRQLSRAPEDTLFDRARQAMEAVKENNPMRADENEPPLQAANDPVEETVFEPELAAEPVSELDTAPEQEPEIEPELEPEENTGFSSLRRDLADAPAEDEAEAVIEPQEIEAEPLDTSSAASPFSALGGAFSQNGPESDTEIEEASTINFAEEESSILDEDTLRDLVSDMVREELQGELGDRITRNVRKLVRREIQRALASREFE